MLALPRITMSAPGCPLLFVSFRAAKSPFISVVFCQDAFSRVCENTIFVSSFMRLKHQHPVAAGVPGHKRIPLYVLLVRRAHISLAVQNESIERHRIKYHQFAHTAPTAGQRCTFDLAFSEETVTPV